MKRSFLQLTLGLALSFALVGSAFATGENNPTGATGDWNGTVNTAGSYDPYTGNAKRFIDDLTVTGGVGAYPLKWNRVLNTRGSSYGNGGWSHSYLWGLWLREGNGGFISNQYEGPDGQLSYPDGRQIPLATSDPYVWGPANRGSEPMDRLVYMPARGNRDYDLVMRDGGRVEFHPDGGATVTGEVTHYLAQAIVDPYGQRTTLTYDSLKRLSKVTEPAGRYLEVSYDRFYGSSHPATSI